MKGARWRHRQIICTGGQFGGGSGGGNARETLCGEDWGAARYQVHEARDAAFGIGASTETNPGSRFLRPSRALVVSALAAPACIHTCTREERSHPRDLVCPLFFSFFSPFFHNPKQFQVRLSDGRGRKGLNLVMDRVDTLDSMVGSLLYSLLSRIFPFRRHIYFAASAMVVVHYRLPLGPFLGGGRSKSESENFYWSIF